MLSTAMLCSAVASNAQLRAMNPHVKSAMRDSQQPSMPVQHKSMRGMEEHVGGVSSFGLQGTIAHAVLALPRVHAQDGHDLIVTRSLIEDVNAVGQDGENTSHQAPLRFFKRRFVLGPATDRSMSGVADVPSLAASSYRAIDSDLLPNLSVKHERRETTVSLCVSEEKRTAIVELDDPGACCPPVPSSPVALADDLARTVQATSTPF